MGAGGGQGTKKYDEGMQENRLKIDEMYSLIPKDQIRDDNNERKTKRSSRKKSK